MIRIIKTRIVVILLLGSLVFSCLTLYKNQRRLMAGPTWLKPNSVTTNTVNDIRVITPITTVIYTVDDGTTKPNEVTIPKKGSRKAEKAVKKAKKEDDLQLDDIFISVKTCGKFHKTRVPIILNTWWEQAKEQIYFFTDIDDGILNNFTNGHAINTHCNSTHSREGLSCKMDNEYSFGLKMNKKWWCHFDDDNYVNIEKLLELLRNYSSDEDYYLGRLSWVEKQITVKYGKGRVSTDFATGGAGICISRATILKMIPLASNGKFHETSKQIRTTDDVNLGFIVYYKLGINVTRIEGLHSHLERLNELPSETLKYQISVGYKNNNTIVLNDPVFPKQDYSKLYSLHCEIHPNINWCLSKTIPKSPIIKTP